VRVLFDMNLILDVLLNRLPHSSVAYKAFALVEYGSVTGLLGATTLTKIYYIGRKEVGDRSATEHIRRLLSIFEIAPVDKGVLNDALTLDFADFEDAVLHEAGRHAGATGIVTRDRTGFVNGTLRVYSPDELLTAVRQTP